LFYAVFLSQLQKSKTELLMRAPNMRFQLTF